MDKKGFFNWLAANRHLSDGSLATTDKKYSFVEKWLGNEKLTPQAVRDFILYIRKKGLKNTTINGYIRIFALIDKYNEYLGIKSELTRGVEYFPKNTRVPTILSIDEIEAIINAQIPFEYKGKHYPGNHDNSYKGLLEKRWKHRNALSRIFIWFLAATGCRIDEAASLTKENLYLGMDANYAHFKDTKTYLDRRVPLPPSLSQELSGWIKEVKPNERVFRSYDGNKIVEQTFNPILRKKVEIAGINKHVYAHCFRNSYIMEHLRCNTDVLTIAKLVGHADVNTTMGYTKFNYEMLEKGAENHPLFAKTLTTEKILQKIIDSIEKWPILQDSRFSFRQEHGANSLLFEIYVK